LHVRRCIDRLAPEDAQRAERGVDDACEHN
jgi:hypothetical protein